MGGLDSAEANDFKTYGATVENVLEKMSTQCRSLTGTEEMSSESSSATDMRFLDISIGGTGSDTTKKFLSLDQHGKYLLIRPCYKGLYEAIVEAWPNNGTNRVLVNGNAGTGKSWFQMYALRRLLQGYGESHRYLFVIRQVGQVLYLIDLSNAQIRRLQMDITIATDCLDLLSDRVLYFFEPLNDRTILPLPVGLDSLATLSPFEERTHEYEKNRFKEFTFPCWTLEHLTTSAENDPNIILELEDVATRFSRFGGIIRHVFAQDTAKYENDQNTRIKDADLTVLRARTTGINSDPKAIGKNVSGILLCYCNIPTEGTTRFQNPELDFTSNYVAGRIRERLKDYSIEEHIQVVVDHLDGQQADRGGLHLQEVVSFLLAKGTDVKWQHKQVTDPASTNNQWFSFRTQVREVVKSYHIAEQLTASKKVLVSMNTNFPLADIVFSCGKDIAVIDSFQVTWQSSHPFTLRALYTLREIYLKIRDTVKIRVFFVTPKEEDAYAAKSKGSFLSGSVDKELKYTSNTKIRPERLQLMWQNTDIYIFKPSAPWIETLRPYR